jgi:hypothetical protein
MPVRAKTPNACAPSFFDSILASRSVTGPSAIAGRYFHRDFFCFTAFLSDPSFVGVFETAFFFLATPNFARKDQKI